MVVFKLSIRVMVRLNNKLNISERIFSGHAQDAHFSELKDIRKTQVRFIQCHSKIVAGKAVVFGVEEDSLGDKVLI
jgi:hypothetical protein